MTIDLDVTRRTLLVAGAGGAGIALLAACGSDDSGGSSQAPADDQTPPTADGSTAAPGGSADSGDSGSSDGSGGSGDAAGNALTSLDDIAVGEAVSVTLPGGKPGLVTRTGQSTAVCFSAICTHQGCTVKPDGKTLACPCHGSTFAAATGKVTGGPAPEPLPKVDVQVVDGKVVAAG